MNLPTQIAIIVIGLAIIVPIFFWLRKRAMGRLKIKFAEFKIDPDRPIKGVVSVKLAKGGVTGPIKLILRCSYKADEMPTSATMHEVTHMLSNGISLRPNEEQEIPFEVLLQPTEQTKHAIHGEMNRYWRQDYTWWAVAEMATREDVSFRTMERINLVARGQ